MKNKRVKENNEILSSEESEPININLVLFIFIIVGSLFLYFIEIFMLI